MGPIQVIPPGLLGFLQLKSSGRNPTQISEELRGVLDLTSWYYQARVIEFTLSPDIPGAGTMNRAISVASGRGFKTWNGGTATSCTVPQTEWWWIDRYTIRAHQAGAGAAGDVDIFQPVIHTTTAGATLTHALGNPFELPFSLTVDRDGLISVGGFFAPPGSELGLGIVEHLSAQTTNYEGFLRLVRLPL